MGRVSYANSYRHFYPVPLDCVFDSIEDLRFPKVYRGIRPLSNEIIRHLIGLYSRPTSSKRIIEARQHAIVTSID
jgi:hypothetical protein